MEIDKWILKESNMVQQCKINCPVCDQDKDSLKVWHNIEGIAYCACDKCSSDKLPHANSDSDIVIKYTEAILKVGFRAGYDKARQEMKDFLNKKN